MEPLFTSELRIGAYFQDADLDSLSQEAGALQIELAGSARALDALGSFLIALARLETQDPHPHEHIEDVRQHSGGVAHLIIRRETP